MKQSCVWPIYQTIIRQCMQIQSATPNWRDMAALAALAFIVACSSHEVLGHGAACLAEGGRITLLTSVYFHCENGGVITDLAGPLANLLFGFGAYVALMRRQCAWSLNMRHLLALTVAFNLFWIAGCMFETAAANKSDFAYPLRVLAVNPSWLGRIALGALGVILYWFGMRAAARYAIQGMSLAIAYAVAGTVSCGAALFFLGPVIPAIREAALESFGSAIGLLLLAGRSRSLSSISTGVSRPSGFGWSVAAALGIIAFCFLLGKGLVFPGNT